MRRASSFAALRPRSVLLPALEIYLEIDVTARRLVDRRARALPENRAAEVGVKNHPGRVDDPSLRVRGDSIDFRGYLAGDVRQELLLGDTIRRDLQQKLAAAID